MHQKELAFVLERPSTSWGRVRHSGAESPWRESRDAQVLHCQQALLHPAASSAGRSRAVNSPCPVTATLALSRGSESITSSLTDATITLIVSFWPVFCLPATSTAGFCDDDAILRGTGHFEIIAYQSRSMRVTAPCFGPHLRPARLALTGAFAAASTPAVMLLTTYEQRITPGHQTSECRFRTLTTVRPIDPAPIRSL